MNGYERPACALVLSGVSDYMGVSSTQGRFEEIEWILTASALCSFDPFHRSGFVGSAPIRDGKSRSRAHWRLHLLSFPLFAVYL